MKKFLSVSALLFTLLFGGQALAAGASPANMTASGAIVGTQIVWCPIGTASDLKCTFTQIATFINSLFSGDCTVTGPGVVTCLKSNGVAFGTGAFANTGTSGATLALLNAANIWSAQQTLSGLLLSGITGSTQCLHVNTSGVVSGTGSDCGSGSGAVSSVTGSCGVGVSPTTGATVVSANLTQRNNTLTTDTIASTDCGNIVTESNASAVAVTLPVATTSGFGTGFYYTQKNKGAGLVTVTPTTSTIDGSATLTVKQNQSVDIYSDGTNYWTLPGRPTNEACADLTNAGALCSTAPGTGVAAAAANNLSAAGGLTSTIASGTAALGTSAIGSAACASAVTVSATNVATTDVVTASFNGDPTAVTGYVPLTTGMLTIVGYPTSGNVNFKVCNNTSASITPGAITLNWRVVR